MAGDPDDTVSLDATVPAVSPEPAPAPRPDDRYVLGAKLGEGGMGVVWAAHDRVLDRQVALKVLHDRYLGGGFQAQLAAEARAMARLTHPNVVAVYDVGERDGRTFLTMELVPGQPVSRWIEQPRPWREVVAVFRAAAAGLAAAHDAGLVHRDVKPSNILIGDDGRVRVADFGIAHAGASGGAAATGILAATTVTEGLVGTPAYMAPERLAGEPADARGDQFGFAAALHEAVHGRRAYGGATLGELRAAIAAGPPRPVRDAPAWLHRVIGRGLAVDPARRFATMHEVVAALGGPPRRRAVAVVAAVGALAIGAVVVVALGRGGGAPACPSASRHLAGVWDPAVEGRLATAWAHVGVPYAAASWAAVERALDDRAASWVQLRDQACRATRVDHEQSEATMERRLACLDERLGGLGRLIETLGHPDVALLGRAGALVSGLPPLTDCADLDFVTGTAGGGAARADLGLAEVQYVAGRYQEAADLAAEVAAAARAAGDRAGAAEALLIRGTAQSRLGATGDAVDTLTEAADLAGAAGVGAFQVEAWAALGGVLQRLGRLDEADHQLALAEAALRDHPDPGREIAVLNGRGTLAGRRGDYAAAAASFERALALTVELEGPDAVAQIPNLDNLSIALRRLGRLDDALAKARRSLELARVLGDEHPEVAEARQALAVVLSELGRLDEARTELSTALALTRRSFGDRSLGVAELEAHLGVVEVRADHLEAAVDHFQTALAIRLPLEPASQGTMTTRANLASTLSRLGRVVEAEPVLRELLAARIAAEGPGHPDVATAHFQLALVLRAQDRLDEAVAELAAARAGYVAVYGADHLELADVAIEDGIIERTRGHAAAALVVDERARAIRDATLPAEHPDRASARISLALDQLALHHPAKARPLAEEAVASLGPDGSVALVASARFALARARWDLRDDRPAAVALARAARAALAAAATAEAAGGVTLAMIDRWLAGK